MFGIGLPELIFIFILALIVLGPEKLPEVAKQLAKLVVDVKKAANEFQKQLELEDLKEDEKELLKLTEINEQDSINPKGLIKENFHSNNYADNYDDDWEKELPKSPEEAKLRASQAENPARIDNHLEESIERDNISSQKRTQEL